MKKNEFLKELKDLQTENKDVKELYMEVSALAMKYLSSQWRPYTGRAAYYFSIEYLMGRMFYNNLMELGVAEQVKEIFAKKGVDMNIFEEVCAWQRRPRTACRVFSRFCCRAVHSFVRIRNPL